MSKVTDEVLKKVSGGSIEEDGKQFGEKFNDAVLSAIASVLNPVLNSLKTDLTYGNAAECILQILQNKGLGGYSVAQVSRTCQTLQGAPQILANESAKEYLQAIDDFVNER